jgi:hypothetical protein
MACERDGLRVLSGDLAQQRLGQCGLPDPHVAGKDDESTAPTEFRPGFEEHPVQLSHLGGPGYQAFALSVSARSHRTRE